MTTSSSDIAFTPAVKAIQAQKGSRASYARMESQGGWQTKVSPDLAGFLAGLDMFYLGTVNGEWQPYIQYRGGPPGFLKVIDDQMLGFADFGGNRQYITLGNLADNPKAFIFLMDYVNRQRIKIWGRAEVIADNAELNERLHDPDYVGKVERSILFHVEAWDANCPQHIHKRYPAIPSEEVDRKIALCYEKGWQFLAHCNGDAASDMMLGAIKDAREKFGKGKDRRDVMIHCQTIREDQLDTMKEYGVIPSMYGMHCFYWGDWHRDSVFGAERAERISPARSALRRGMIFSQHHDAPIALPNAIRVLSSVVTRRTRSGDILGAGQCIPVDAALKSITIWAAYHHYEEANRGSIEVGKLADFVVLDKNPHNVPILELSELKVMETIKNGKTIYLAK